MKYSLTIFKNTYDNQTHRGMDIKTWSEFEELLYYMFDKEGSKGGRDSSVLISPARYYVDTTRSNKNVSSWGGWAALDVDDFVLRPDSNVNPADSLKEQLAERYGRFNYIC
jgi:hypothetical protein